MSNPLKPLLALSLVAGFGLQVSDVTKHMDTDPSTWPEKHHIGVICDYGASLEAVEDLAATAGSEARITVAHVYDLDDYRRAVDLLLHHNVNFLVLIPRDNLVRDGPALLHRPGHPGRVPGEYRPEGNHRVHHGPPLFVEVRHEPCAPGQGRSHDLRASVCDPLTPMEIRLE